MKILALIVCLTTVACDSSRKGTADPSALPVTGQAAATTAPKGATPPATAKVETPPATAKGPAKTATAKDPAKPATAKDPAKTPTAKDPAKPATAKDPAKTATAKDSAKTATEAKARRPKAVTPPKKRPIATIPPGLQVNDSLIRFSADGKKVAYSATVGANKRLVVINAEKGPVYEHVSPVPVIGSAGKVAYTVKKGADHHVAVDHELGPAFTEVGEPVFSPDQSRLVYRATTAQGQVLVVNHKPQAEVFVKLSQPVFSPDGKTISVAATNAKGEVSVDGGRAFRNIVGPAYQPDGTLIYAGQTATGWEVVEGTVAKPVNFVPISAPITSERGDRVAWIIRSKDGMALLVDGKVEASQRVIGQVVLPSSGPAIFTAEFKGPERGWARFPGGADGPFRKAITHLVGAEGHLAEVIRPLKGDISNHLFVDGRKVARFAMIGEPRFIDKGKAVAFGAREVRTLMWVTVTL